MTPMMRVPTWGDLQRMAAEIKRATPKIGSKVSAETFYTLTYLEAIQVDAQADSAPFHD